MQIFYTVDLVIEAIARLSSLGATQLELGSGCHPCFQLLAADVLTLQIFQRFIVRIFTDFLWQKESDVIFRRRLITESGGKPLTIEVEEE